MSEIVSAVMRDLLGICVLAKVETKMHLIEKRGLVVPDLFRKLVRMQPNKACIVFNDQVWTFQNVSFIIVWLAFAFIIPLNRCLRRLKKTEIDISLEVMENLGKPDNFSMKSIVFLCNLSVVIDLEGSILDKWSRKRIWDGEIEFKKL